MSYDIYLLALQPGDSVDEIFERMELEETQALPGPELRATLAAIADDFAAEGYELIEGESFLNIVNNEFGSVFDLRAEGATVNVAYWHSGDEAHRVMRSVIGLTSRIQGATGWAAFDPQRGEIVKDLADLVAGSSGEMDSVSRWADKNLSNPGKRPWWKFWA